MSLSSGSKEWSAKEFTWSSCELRAKRKASKEGVSLAPLVEETRGKGNKKQEKIVFCQIDGCDNICETAYYRKYKICEEHGKSPAVSLHGSLCRFCQKCARFHNLAEFDGSRRSCRAMLAQHNMRRTRAKKSMKERYLGTKKRTMSSDVKSGGVVVRNDGVAKNPETVVLHAQEDRSCAECGVLGTACIEQESLHVLGIVSKRNGNIAANVGSEDDTEALKSGVDLIAGSEPVDEPLAQQLDGKNLVDFSLTSTLTDEYSNDEVVHMSDFNLDSSFYDAGNSEYVSPYEVHDMDLNLHFKFPGCVPTDLPDSLLMDVNQKIPGATMVEGFIRPGCTHLTISMRMSSAEFERDGTTLKRAMFHLYHEWCSSIGKGIHMKAGSVKVMPNDEKILHPAWAKHILLFLSPCCVSTEGGGLQSAVVDLHGINVHESKAGALCRQHGEHLTVSVLPYESTDDESDHWDESDLSNESDSSDAYDSSGSPISKRSSRSCVLDGYALSNESLDGVENQKAMSTGNPILLQKKSDVSPTISVKPVKIIGLNYGVAEIEIVCEESLSSSLPLLVLPDDQAACEVSKLVGNHQGKSWSKCFMRDVGFVIKHLYVKPVEDSMTPMVKKIAARTVSYCMERGCYSLASLLQQALSEEKVNGSFPGCEEAFFMETHADSKFPDVGQSKANTTTANRASLIQALNAEKARHVAESLQYWEERRDAQEWQDGGWWGISHQVVVGLGVVLVALVLANVWS